MWKRTLAVNRRALGIPVVSILVALALAGYCTEAQSQMLKRERAYAEGVALLRRFDNLLDARGTPRNAKDNHEDLFFDFGSWHGFGLPAPRDMERQGGFTGPFVLINDGEWISPQLVRLVLLQGKEREKVVLSDDARTKLASYPGYLAEEYEAGGLHVELDLWFVSDRSALIVANISNRSAEATRLETGWEGEAFGGFQLQENKNGVRVSEPKSPGFAQVVFPSPGAHISIDEESGLRYRAIGAPLVLKPGASVRISAAESFYFNEGERAKDSASLAQALSDPEASFAAAQRRWSGYLKPLFARLPSSPEKKMREAVVVKAVETLIGNWRSPAGDLTIDGLFPSWMKFQGFWAWDSWKHAAALALFAPELAKNQVRAMFTYQTSSGMLPDVIFRKKEQNNLRNTKPPLAAWAVWQIYSVTKDIGFVREMYPQLLRYHRWWHTNRDNDGDGLCEYGASDGTMEAAKWESGMDNAIRFDDAQILKNGPDAYSLDQESVDLNSYLFAEKKYLVRMARILGDRATAALLEQEALLLRKHIREKMFDPETGYFYDIRLDGKRFVHLEGPEGWIPLWAGVATAEEAESVRKVLIDPKKFATPLPFPTVAADAAKFQPADGYWRGPVWLDQAYFAIAGLHAYGFHEDARRFERQVLEHTRASIKGVPIRETYNPLTGDGQNSRDFGWSSVSLLLLAVEDFANATPREQLDSSVTMLTHHK